MRTPDVCMEFLEGCVLSAADRTDELSHLHGSPPLRWPAHLQSLPAAISLIVRPEMTERVSVATRSRPGAASASSIFTRSQASPFPVLNRVRAYPPLTFSPSSQTDTWPRPIAPATGTSCPSFRVRF